MGGKDGKLYTQPEFEAKFGSLALLTEWNDLPVVDFKRDAAQAARCENPHGLSVEERKWQARMEKYRIKFNHLDISKDGALDYNEMKPLLRAGNPNISEKAMRKLFNAADQNGNGRIDFEEFCYYLHDKDAIDETYGGSRRQ